MKKIIICLFIVLFVVFIRSFNYYAISADSIDEGQESEAEVYSSEIYSNLIDYEVDPGAIFEYKIIIDFKSTISTYEVVDASGFNLYYFDTSLLDNEDVLLMNNFIIYIQHDILIDNPYIELKFILNNGEELSVCLYGLLIDNKLYLSRFSYNDILYFYDLQKDNLRKRIYKDNQNLRSDSITIDGTLEWKYQQVVNGPTDSSNHPLQFLKVELVTDDEDNNIVVLGTCYTDVDGYFSFTVDNEYDNYHVVLYAGSYYFQVYNFITATVYQRIQNYGYLYSDTDASYVIEIPIYYTNTMYYFREAIFVAQAYAYASMYYWNMKDDDINSVGVIYAHNSGTTGCYYSSDYNYIFIARLHYYDSSGNQYEYWDTLMHEYGHFVSHQEEIDLSPGKKHFINRSMADLYYKHLDPSHICDSDHCPIYDVTLSFAQSQSKLMGMRLAWSEGFATFFGQLVQEYYANYLTNIRFVCDHDYRGPGFNIDVEYISGIEYNDTCEHAITGLLYDMYDNYNNNETFDCLSFAHQTMFNLIVNSQATTFFDFYLYLMSYYSNNVPFKRDFSKLITEYNFSLEVNNSNNFTFERPTISWITPGLYTYFNDYSFQLKFYDENGNFIASSVVTNNNFDSVYSSVYRDVLNSGSYFYVSLTTLENSYYANYYEGKRKQYNRPVVYTALLNTTCTETIDEGDYIWYEFTAAANGLYHFESSGQYDLDCEIFSVINVGNETYGLLAYDLNSGNGSNYSLDYQMIQGETIYLRISNNSLLDVSSNLLITLNNHNHAYTYSYEYYSTRKHKASCQCGDFIYENHTFVPQGIGMKCTKCRYYTTDPVIRNNNKSNIENLIYYYLYKVRSNI